MLKEIFVIFLIAKASTSSYLSVKWESEIVSEDERWNSVSEYMRKVMFNEKKGFIDLFIYDATDGSMFTSFLKHLSKEEDKIVKRTAQLFAYDSILRVPDFGLILLDIPARLSGQRHVTKQFRITIFPHLSLRIFVILKVNNKKQIPSVSKQMIFNLIPPYYRNIHLVVSYPDRFEVVKLKYDRVVEEVDVSKFDFPFKKMVGVNSKTIKLIQWDAPALSRVENRLLVGLEGNVLDTFCEKHGVDYVIQNKRTEKIIIVELFQMMTSHRAELNLNTEASLGMPEIENIDLGEIDGLCILAPRNIYTSSYASSYPFDYTTTILIVLATISTVFWWRVISMSSKSNFKLSFILINIYKCFIGQGVSKEENMCKKEKLLIYSYIVGSMVFVSLYQSIMISIMLSEPVMKSIQSLKELNESETKIFKFFSPHDFNHVVFRDDLVLSHIDINSTDGALRVPPNFDRDLAYVVQCSYADTFLMTSRNYEGNQRLFNRIPEKFSMFHQSYTMSTAFPLQNELKFHVEALRESGIRNYWKSKLVNDGTIDLKDKLEDEDKKLLVDFKNMLIPLYALATGCALGLFIFIFEHLIHQATDWKRRQVVVLSKAKKGRWNLKTDFFEKKKRTATLPFNK